jgi:Protein of unknown function (DUF2281)
MAAQMVPTTVVSPQMLGVLEKLSPELRQQVFDFAEFLGQRQDQGGDDKSAQPVKPPRVFGLHAGQVWMSDDFDDPLPEGNWVDKIAGSMRDVPDFDEVSRLGRRICEGEYELLIPPDEYDRVIQRLSALRDARTLDSGAAVECGESEDELRGMKR